MITPEQIFQQIVELYHTNDPTLIAQKAGVNVVEASWCPVTYGEYDRCTKTIVINRQSNFDRNIILTHELGHYLIDIYQIKLSRQEEEKWVESFVRLLV